MIRAVLDNNIIISGVFWDKIPEQVYRLASSHYILATSAELCKELRDVLGRQKFARTFAATNRTPDQVYSAYIKTAELITSGDVPPGAVRDDDDRPVLACAVGGKADYIVTGDNDLLVIEGSQYKGIKIVPPSQFLQVLAAIDAE